MGNFPQDLESQLAKASAATAYLSAIRLTNINSFNIKERLLTQLFSFCDWPVDVSGFKQFKVFGERHAGTNFLQKILRDNLEGVTEAPRPERSDKKEFMRRQRRLPPWTARVLPKRIDWILNRGHLVNAWEDQLFIDSTPYHFGWKHAALDIESLATLPGFSGTLFVCIVRHPLRFLISMHRQPYDIQSGVPESMLEFIDTPIVTNRRDGIADAIIQSPVQLWAIKTASYVEASKLENIVLIRYEDLITSPDLLFQWWSESGGNRAEPISIPHASVKKKSTATLSDYKEEAKAMQFESRFSDQEIKKVKEKIPIELIKRLQYYL